jgi:hypothetical protein
MTKPTMANASHNTNKAIIKPMALPPFFRLTSRFGARGVPVDAPGQTPERDGGTRVRRNSS